MSKINTLSDERIEEISEDIHFYGAFNIIQRAIEEERKLIAAWILEKSKDKKLDRWSSWENLEMLAKELI